MTLVDLLRKQSIDEPDKGYSFLDSGIQERGSVTFQALDLEARRIAGMLQAAGLTGTRALLLYPSGIDFINAFFGCLYAGVIPVPTPHPSPLHLKRTLPRFHAIATDACPSVLLTCSKVLDQFNNAPPMPDSMASVPFFRTDQADPQFETNYRQFAPIQGDLAYIQYTSGSTATPKGVMVSHANVISNLASLDSGWDHSPESVLVSWLPLFHDMGLVYGLLQALYNGCRCYLMTPFSFIRDPFRWLDAMSHFRGTHTAAPNFAYDLCVERITPAQRALLDLSAWKVAVNGSEPVRSGTLERFSASFADCGFNRRAFCPGYGLAEATLKVTAIRASEDLAFSEPLRQLVSCGRPGPDVRAIIVEPESRVELGPEQVGEIWVSGQGVAQGYWRRPAETSHTFQAFLGDSGDGPFLRTGDLGFLQNGELFITGRLKDLIVIRGKNYFPADIEQTVERCDPACRGASTVAFSSEINHEERLIIVQEIPRKRPPDSLGALARAIHRAVADEHELDAFAVILVADGSLPKTSSGKLERAACKASYLSGKLSIIPYENGPVAVRLTPRNPVEHALTAIVAEVLGIGEVGVMDDFLELGGNSLQATQVISRVRAAMKVELQQDALFAAPTIAELAILVSQSEPARNESSIRKGVR